jgi:hypothetical protein
MKLRSRSRRLWKLDLCHSSSRREISATFESATVRF